MIDNQKKKFIFWGICNVFLTNTILHILLIYTEIIISTLISQVFNIVFGYLIYSKKVFNKKKLTYKNFFFFIILAFFNWNLNWIFISKLNNLGFSKNFAAIIIAPLLALISYYIQKYLVFRTMNK